MIQTSLMATIPLLDTVMPKFEKNTVEFILLGYPLDFPELGLSKHTRFHPKKKIINCLFPIKVDTTGFFREKLHFQTQTIGESKSLMINQLILIIPRKTSLYFP